MYFVVLNVLCVCVCIVFSLQFVGRWYETAVASTCPHYSLRKKGNPVIVALEIKNVTSEGNFTMLASAFRSDSCGVKTSKENKCMFHFK